MVVNNPLQPGWLWEVPLNSHERWASFWKVVRNHWKIHRDKIPIFPGQRKRTKPPDPSSKNWDGATWCTGSPTRRYRVPAAILALARLGKWRHSVESSRSEKSWDAQRFFSNIFRLANTFMYHEKWWNHQILRKKHLQDGKIKYTTYNPKNVKKRSIPSFEGLDESFSNIPRGPA